MSCNRVVIVERPRRQVVIAVGRQGQRGQSGSGGGSTFEWTQSIPLSVWTVPHNLERYPSVTVAISDDVVISDVRYIDENIVQITHGSPLTGKVYCN